MDQPSQVSRAGVMASAAECANATTEFMVARERKQSADAALYEAEQRVKNAREQHSV